MLLCKVLKHIMKGKYIMTRLNDSPDMVSRRFRINVGRLGDVHEKSSLKVDEKINKQWTSPSIKKERSSR